MHGWKGTFASFTCGVLAAICFVEAAIEQVHLKEDGIKFKVQLNTNSAKYPYRVVFNDDGVRSVYLFTPEGKVNVLKAGTEKYKSKYDADGLLTKVNRIDAAARMLLPASPSAVSAPSTSGEDRVTGDSERRRLYTCDDCEQTYDTICSVGVDSVCALQYVSSVLGASGAASVKAMCSSFRTACHSTSATDACDGECEEEEEEEAGPCGPNPCLNGGSCSLDPGGGHVCSCASGYGGMSCQTDTSALAEFYIQVEFLGDLDAWTDTRKAVMTSAADRWAEVITHHPCGGDAGVPDGRLLIVAQLQPIDGVDGAVGFAGPSNLRFDCPTISTVGDMTFDSADIAFMEEIGVFEGVVMHEMGHVIGVGTLWGDCSTCTQDGDTTWKCPETIEAYNDLLGDATGTDADIIEADFGPGTACGHWDEFDIFGDELMTAFISTGSMPLSKITASSLEDTGYVVNPAAVDDYTLPSMRGGAGAPNDEAGTFLNETAVSKTLEVVGKDGETLEIETVTIMF